MAAGNKMFTVDKFLGVNEAWQREVRWMYGHIFFFIIK